MENNSKKEPIKKVVYQNVYRLSSGVEYAKANLHPSLESAREMMKKSIDAGSVAGYTISYEVTVHPFIP